MIIRVLVLMMIPVVINSEIVITMHMTNLQNSTVLFKGGSHDLISDIDRITFGITNKQLRTAVEMFSGEYPSDVFVKSPTPWGDLYYMYKWEQVFKTLLPYDANVVSMRSSPVVLSTQRFINRGNVTAVYNAALMENVEHSTSTRWYKKGDLTFHANIQYNINFLSGEVSGDVNMNYVNQWGEEKKFAVKMSVGTSSSVGVTLAPGQAVIAELLAYHTYSQVEIDYSTSLDGDVACNYRDLYKGHHFWKYKIIDIMLNAHIPNSIKSKEFLTIEYYSNAEITVKDLKYNRPLVRKPVGLSPYRPGGKRYRT